MRRSTRLFVWKTGRCYAEKDGRRQKKGSRGANLWNPWNLRNPWNLLFPSSLCDFERLIELEREDRFGLDADIALRQRLRCGASAGAHTSSNRRALGAAENRADDATDRRAAACEFGRAFV